MDNKIEHFFVLKPDGKIYWIQEPVKVPAFASSTRGIGRYNHALQSAIDNAVEVENHEIVKVMLIAKNEVNKLGIGTFYPLECSVEKKVSGHSKVIPGEPPWFTPIQQDHTYPVALVTFSQPEDEMSGIGWVRPPDNEETYTPLTFDEAVKNRSLRLGATTFKEISELWSIACDVIEQMKTKPEEKETQEERYDGFKVTIDDGFVVYEYKFPKGEHLSIHQIAEAISDQTGLEIESSIQVNP